MDILKKRLEGLCVIAEYELRSGLGNDSRVALAKVLIGDELLSDPQQL